MSQKITVKGKIVNIDAQTIKGGIITIKDNKIEKIDYDDSIGGPYILPGFVDSHIHIESSMLTPQYFGQEAVKHGTIATISDPHEIANVLGVTGINSILKDSRKTPLKIFFGVPSCVPATPFETSGAVLNSNEVNRLISQKDFYYLAEMMNFPGVINNDPEVMKKINSARANNKPVDGHVPGLTGEDLSKYINAGITTDHECGNYEEAVEKIKKGMKIQIREGSAAKDFDNLYKLIDEFPNNVMLCSDDKHPDDLIYGHINKLMSKGIDYGLDLFNLLKAAIINPVKHYNLPLGLLREGDPADFILVEDLKHFNVLQAYIEGQSLYKSGHSNINISENKFPNVMNARKINQTDLKVSSESLPVKVIHAEDRTLYTSHQSYNIKDKDGYLTSDLDQDILKIVVVNRYQPAQPSIGFIHNFGLQKGAIATSVAHDSHNIICVGVADEDIVHSVNSLIELGGGNVVYDGSQVDSLSLEFGGLMTQRPAAEVAEAYNRLNSKVEQLGCQLAAPFMTLAFMALPVIPELKITDKGLFDVTNFEYTGLFQE